MTPFLATGLTTADNPGSFSVSAPGQNGSSLAGTAVAQGECILPGTPRADERVPPRRRAAEVSTSCLPTIQTERADQLLLQGA
jgi:hypothetical protein